jgi:hypothetical protein
LAALVDCAALWFTKNFPTTGWQVVATATDKNGNTSGFADPVTVQKAA